jgi:hypothetical protein
MAKIIIEEVNRLGHVTGRHCFDHFPVSIGRGYQNDLIIDDPYISAEHASIHETENGWLIEDKHSDNGIKFRLHSTQSHTNHLNSGDEMIAGRTRLRLLSPWHPVAKTHLLPTKTSVSKILANPGVAAGTILLALMLVLIDNQLSIAVKTGFEKLIASAFPTFIFALVWAGIWAFVGRVIIHRASFLPHFVAALLVFIISMVTASITGYITYNLSTSLVASMIEFVVVGFTIAGLFYINLANSTNLNKRSNLITSHTVAWSMLLMGLFMQYVNKPEFSHAPEYASELKPPFAKVVSSQSIDDFMKESETVFKHREQKK